MTEVKFYMLVEREDALYLALYDSEKNLISSYSNLNQNDINNYIENVSDTLSYHEDKSIFFTDISDLVKDIYNNSSKILNSYQNEKQYIIDKNGIR